MNHRCVYVFCVFCVCMCVRVCVCVFVCVCVCVFLIHICKLHQYRLSIRISTGIEHFRVRHAYQSETFALKVHPTTLVGNAIFEKSFDGLWELAVGEGKHLVFGLRCCCLCLVLYLDCIV
jgi:hypothetical protein